MSRSLKLEAMPVELKTCFEKSTCIKVFIQPVQLNRLVYDSCVLAHRMYELMLIRRPGDLLSYLIVTFDDVAAAQFEKNQKYTSTKLDPEKSNEQHTHAMKLVNFDLLFASSDEDPIADSWGSFFHGSGFKPRLTQWFDQILEAQNALSRGDELQRHCFDQVKKNKHPLDHLAADRAIQLVRNTKPQPSLKTSLYDKLNELLEQKDVESVSMLWGDYSMLRQMCNQQRKRKNHCTLPNIEVFPINTVSSGGNSLAQSWDADINYYGEGLGRGDLFIAPPFFESDSAKFDPSIFRFPQYVLCIKSMGEIEGYEAESGDGWYCYCLLDSSIAGKEVNRDKVLAKNIWNFEQIDIV